MLWIILAIVIAAAYLLDRHYIVGQIKTVDQALTIDINFAHNRISGWTSTFAKQSAQAPVFPAKPIDPAATGQVQGGGVPPPATPIAGA